MQVSDELDELLALAVASPAFAAPVKYARDADTSGAFSVSEAKDWAEIANNAAGAVNNIASYVMSCVSLVANSNTLVQDVQAPAGPP